MVPSDSDDDLEVPDGPGATNIPPTIYVLKVSKVYTQKQRI